MRKTLKKSDYLKMQQSVYDKRAKNTELPEKKILIKKTDNRNPIEYNQYPDKCHYILNEIVYGLNGSKGLMNSHWTEIKKLKQKYCIMFLSVNPKKWNGKVNFSFTRYSSALMDPVNLASTTKKIVDALVSCKIIHGDTPDLICEIPHQEKCKRKEQRFEFIISQ